MGIYLSNMEMPTNCEKCPFLDYEEGFCFASGAEGKSGWYEFTLRPGEIKDRRHDDCPLVPVPPHGRLIDADALITTFCEWGTRLERGRKLVITMSEAKQAIVDIIEDAPTIIPASEESET